MANAGDIQLWLAQHGFGKYVIERVRRWPMLLLITFRPEFQPPWIGRPYVTTIALNRLDLRDILNRHHLLVREQLRRHRGREINTAGDAFLAAFDGPARAVRCGREIADAVKKLGIHIRAGVHTAECEVMGENLGGIAVHIGARIGALASADQVLVSSTVRDLVAGSGLKFEDRGTHTSKGVPGDWHLLAAM
jgi:class 3 adenylate cyclase